jgi:hypothetical protein
MLLNVWHGMNPDTCSVAAFESGHFVLDIRCRTYVGAQILLRTD